MGALDRTQRLLDPPSLLDHMIGAVSAPIAIVQYGDYASARSAEAFLVAEDVRRWLAPRVRVVYRHCVDARVAASHLAAEAAEAAELQGQFWGMHRLLVAAPAALDLPMLVAYARSLELDQGRFLRELRSEPAAARIARDRHSAGRSGVAVAPVLFVNGWRYAGELDSDELLDGIEVLAEGD